MSIWDQFKQTATVGGPAEFPQVPPDVYDAEIIEVSEPQDMPKFGKPGEMTTRFHLVWRIPELEGVIDPPTIWDWMSLPDGYLESGFVHEKSTIYNVMQALGYDLSGEFTVDPESWVGKKARITIKEKKNPDTGEVRTKVTDRNVLRRPRPAVAPEERKQPVGASAGRGLRARMEADTEDD